MIIAATGHRPNKLGGYNQKVFQELNDLATNWLKINRPKKIISGMALGWDQAIAQAAIELCIPVLAAIPFDGQHYVWPDKAQKIYLNILSQCKEIKNVSPGPYAAWKLQKRNEWMVDNCDELVALWNGGPGGTKNCIDYAHKQGKRVINLWKDWE